MNQAIPTPYGFKWGPLTVERLASNDGTDKRAKYWAVCLKTDTDVLVVTSRANGELVIQERCDDIHEVGCAYIHAEGELCETE